MPGLAASSAQAATGVGPVGTVPQVVVVKLLPGPAEAGAQAAVGVGPVGTVLQVTRPIVATQVPGATAVQVDVSVLQDWSCDVLTVVCDVRRLSCDVRLLICAVRALIWKVVFISGVSNSLAIWVVVSILPIVPATAMPASGSANQMWPSGPRVSGPGLKVAITAGPVTG